MAEQLKIVIDADVNGALNGMKAIQGGIAKLNKTTLDFVSTLKGSFDPAVFKSFVGGTANINQMKLALETLKENMRLTTDPRQLVQYNLAIKDIETNIKKASVAGTQLGGTAGKAFSSLTQSAFSLARILPGIGIAGLIGLASDALINLASSLLKANEAATKNSEIIGGAGKEYQNAVSNVNQLKTEIELARDGFISKDGVVKHYNETIGKTTGLVKNLDEAEQALNKNADAYIKFTLLKAAANVAQGKAAEQLFSKATQEQKDFEKNFADFGKRTGKLTLGATDAGAGDLTPLQKRQLDAQKKTKEIFDKRIKGFEDIAKDFNTQAALIASSFKFDFFEDIDPTKDKKTQDEILSRARQFVKEFGDVFVLPDLKETFFKGVKELLPEAKKVLSDFSTGNLKIRLPKIEFELLPENIVPLTDAQLQELTKGFFEGIALEKGIPLDVTIDPTIQFAVDQGKLKDSLNAALGKGDLKTSLDLLQKIDLNPAIAGVQGLNDSLAQSALLINDTLTPAFQSMFDAIEAGKNPLKAFFSSLVQSINQVIKKLIAAAVQAAILSAITGGTSGSLGGFGKILTSILGGQANFSGAGLGGAIGGQAFNNVLNVNVIGVVSGDNIRLVQQRAANSAGRFG